MDRGVHGKNHPPPEPYEDGEEKKPHENPDNVYLERTYFKACTFKSNGGHRPAEGGEECGKFPQVLLHGSIVEAAIVVKKL